MIRLLIRLYPEWWRRRYGQELEALLEDSEPRWCDAWDLLRGAMQMQMKTWSFGRIVTVSGLAGLVLTATAVFSFPPSYSSTAILKVPHGDKPTVNTVNDAALAALTRNSLVTIIIKQNLYTSERKRMPMEDVIDKVMHRDIHITPIILGSGRTRINGIEVRFDYPDPSKTQQVTQTLAERLQGFEVLDPPSHPARIRDFYTRFGLAGFGLLVGLLFGVVLALIFRRRAPAS